ncbi:MAG: ATP-dependent zinc metalloprotease FtsH [Alphaproteobacteria bacterium]
MNSSKSFLIWILVAVTLIALFNAFNETSVSTRSSKVAFSDFMDKAEQGYVREVVIKGASVNGIMADGTSFNTYTPYDPELVPVLRKNNVKVTAMPLDDGGSTFWNIVISWFPMILLIGVWIFFMRQMSAGNGKAMSFGKSKARLLGEGSEKVTFENVAGIDEAKEDLEEIIDYLKDPSKFQRLGGKIPKGVLLVGPPGTGKTLLAKAVAGEAKVPFFSISGSDFVEMFVGVGASRVRDMFEQGKKNAPCLIFIDEIDAVGRHRGAGLGGGNDEREQTLNQLLVEMDGFETNEGVIIVAATNRPDVLDPALLRPGRFDRQVTVPNPDLSGREQILKVHIKKVPIAPDVDVSVIARGTPGFSGADLANLVNEAALLAARRNKRLVTMKEFDYAKDKVMMGAERRSMMMDEAEKKLTAYHEAGHALCSMYVEEADPIHKATIIPRGRALGMVQQLPEKDHLSYSKRKLKSRLVILMGGRIAEEVVFGKDSITNGASSDISHATKLARSMVTEWGFSEELGAMAYDEPDGEVFLGHTVTQRKNISDETAKKVDNEIKSFVDEGFNRAKEIISEHKEKLINIAEALIEFETLTGDEIKAIINGEKIERKDDKPKTGIRASVPTTEEAENVEDVSVDESPDNDQKSEPENNEE